MKTIVQKKFTEKMKKSHHLKWCNKRQKIGEKNVSKNIENKTIEAIKMKFDGEGWFEEGVEPPILSQMTGS